MTTVNKYRIYCNDESNWIETWSENIITVCPNNNSHSVNSNSVQLSDTVSNLTIDSIDSSVTLNTSSSIGDSANLDAFGRLRVSNPMTLFSSKLLRQSKEPTIWDEELVSGSGITSSTPTFNKPYTDITSTSSIAGTFIRQTKYRFDYRPGTSFVILITGVLNLSGGGTDVERCLGYYDDNNGLFFYYNNGVFGVAYRSKVTDSVVTNKITQSNFNIDKMDGTGISGITLDFTKSLIFLIDFQWLSIGRVRWGVEIEGKLYYIHYINHSNVENTAYMSTPNLPLRIEMITSSSSPVSSMRAICCAIVTEGLYNPPLYLVNVSTGTGRINANSISNTYLLCAVRLKTGFEGANISVRNISLLATTTDSFQWHVLINPTIDVSITFTDIDESSCQGATGDTVSSDSTTTISDLGFTVANGYGNTNTPGDINLESSVRLGTKINGTRDIIALAVTPLSINLDIYGALVVNEIFN